MRLFRLRNRTAYTAQLKASRPQRQAMSNTYPPTRSDERGCALHERDPPVLGFSLHWTQPRQPATDILTCRDEGLSWWTARLMGGEVKLMAGERSSWAVRRSSWAVRRSSWAVSRSITLR